MYLWFLSPKYREMSKDYIFRELECQMTKEEVAELCFKSVRIVTGWDEGNPIPPECKRFKSEQRLHKEPITTFKLLF
ncbi:hypothetical protein VCHA38P215_340002 [Vibrio chagasii]|nr:hypothetical protein VCHA38P215_340002 [Vibrio chagasii]CAH7217385.1 hypothetical protein VCHA48P434_320015 [Vibrio chagasii]